MLSNIKGNGKKAVWWVRIVFANIGLSLSWKSFIKILYEMFNNIKGL